MVGCLKPCHEMKFRAEKQFARNKYKDHGTMRLIPPTTVTYSTDTYSYSPFALIVEVGSALGLWIGLSALGCYDEVLQLFSFYLKNKFSQL